MACLHRSIFKENKSLKSATDLFWPAHDGASTSNHGLSSMNGNRSLRCCVISQPFELRTKTHRSCDCLNRNPNCDDHIFISLSVKALRQNVRTDGKNVRALAQTVEALVKSVSKKCSKPLNIRQPSVSFKPFNGQSLVYVFPWKVTNYFTERFLKTDSCHKFKIHP